MFTKKQPGFPSEAVVASQPSANPVSTEASADLGAKKSKSLFFKKDPLTSTVLIVLVFFASQAAAGIIIAIYPAFRNWTSDQGSAWLASSILAQFVYVLLAEVFAVWLVFGLLKRAHVTKAQIGLIKPRFRDIAYALTGYAIYFVCYFIIILIAGHFSHLLNVDQPQKLGFDGASGKQLYLVFISLVLLPPIAEEIMFRGFLFTSLRRKFKLRYAVILTSLLFGIAHLEFGNGAPLLWVAALDTFTLSCVLCNLRERSNSLWPSIMLHALKNTVAFVALYRTKF